MSDAHKDIKKKLKDLQDLLDRQLKEWKDS